MSIAQLFDTVQAYRFATKQFRGKRLLPRRRRKPLFERLEPRLLLSADLSYAAFTTHHDLTLKAITNVLNLYDTGTSTLEGSATLSNPGDSTVTIERGSGQGSLNGDTLRLDLDSFSTLNTFVQGDGGKLSITFDGGDQRVMPDTVTLENQEGGTGTIGYSLSVTSNSQISSSGTVSVAGNLSLISEQTNISGDGVTGVGLLANANTGITLTGAHLTTTTGGTLTLEAHSNLAVNSDGSATGDASAISQLGADAQNFIDKNLGNGNLTGVSIVASFNSAKIDMVSSARYSSVR